MPTPKHPDAGTRKALTEAFNRRAEEADVDGRTDFWGLQAGIARGLVIDSEAFVQVIMTDDGPRLRIIPPELIDESMTRELPGGGVIEPPRVCRRPNSPYHATISSVFRFA